MKTVHRFVLLASLFFASTHVHAAEPTDPAMLFPANTLAYAELHDPATVGPMLAAAFKGSQLEDSIAYIQTRREKSKDPRDHFMKDQLAILGLLASPELSAEFKRLGGVAFGITGFNDQNNPEWAAAVLTGDSAAAGLAARALFTLTTARKVGMVGDVPVFQFKQLQMGYDPNGRQLLQTDKMTEGAYEPTFAYIPGLFVVGSSKSSVAEVLSRFQKKNADSLAAQNDFKTASAGYRKPGLFVYANAPAFLAKRDTSKKLTPMEMEPDALAWFKLLTNAKAVRAVSGNLTFRDGGLAGSFGCTLEPGQSSPLFDLLLAPGVKIDLLRHAPAPATFAVAVSFPEANRAAILLNFLDSVAKANGELGRTPSEAVKELEAKLKVSITDSLLVKTSGATLVLPVTQDLPKEAAALPILTLHSETQEVASGWADLLPKLIGDLAGGDAPQVASETIDGLKVVSIPAGSLPWRAALHYALKGNAITIGLDRKRVAAAAGGTAPAPDLKVPRENASLIGSIHAGGLVRLLTATTPPKGPVVPRGPATPAKTTPGFGRGDFDFLETPQSVDQANVPDAQKKNEAAASADLLKSLDDWPIASFSAKRTGASVHLEFVQPKVHGTGLAPFLNASLNWYDLRLNRTINPNQQYGPRFGHFHNPW